MSVAVEDDIPIYARISTGYRAFLSAIIMIGSFMAILDTTVVDVVIPKMMGPLSTDLYGVQWVITSYMIAAAVGLLLTHSLGKVIGLKNVFLAGLIIFTSASALCGLAGSLPQMISARVLQGMGEAFIMASAQTILFSLYPPEKHGLAMGIYAMGVSFAPSLGPTVGGWITQHLAWRWVFYINVPTGILNFVAALSFLPIMVRHRQKLHFNFISYFFIATFTVALLILLSKGQQLGWGQSSLIVILGAVAAIALILYVISEMFSTMPLIDMRIFRIRRYTLSMGFYFLVMGLSVYQLFYLLPLYYETLKQLGTFATGIHMLSFAIFIAILSPLAGILSDRFGPPPILVVSTVIFLITSFYLIPSLNYYTPSVQAALITIPLGIALGSFFAPVSALALGNLGPYTSQGVSIMHYLRFLGGSLGTAMATNTLELRQAVHYEGIANLQNWGYVHDYVTGIGHTLTAYMPTDQALAHGYGLLAKIQNLQALSIAFQDTFRHTSFFGALGSIFLILLVLDARQTKIQKSGV
jgi:DHA2 family multidrug resistance protein